MNQGASGNRPDPFKLVDLTQDPEAAFKYVMATFTPEVRAHLDQIRTLLGKDTKHSVFLMLAMGAELLRRLESSRDEIQQPVDRIASLLLDIADALQKRIDNVVLTQGVEKSLLQTQVSVTLQPLTDVTALLREAESAIIEATADLGVAKNAVTTVDHETAEQIAEIIALAVIPKLEQSLLQNINDSIESIPFIQRVFRYSNGLMLGIAFASGAGLVLIFLALTHHHVK